MLIDCCLCFSFYSGSFCWFDVVSNVLILILIRSFPPVSSPPHESKLSIPQHNHSNNRHVVPSVLVMMQTCLSCCVCELWVLPTCVLNLCYCLGVCFVLSCPWKTFHFSSRILLQFQKVQPPLSPGVMSVVRVMTRVLAGGSAIHTWLGITPPGLNDPLRGKKYFPKIVALHDMETRKRLWKHFTLHGVRGRRCKIVETHPMWPLDHYIFFFHQCEGGLIVWRMNASLLNK